MALIPCPVCGAQVSDTASKCPHCGAILNQNPADSYTVCPECAYSYLSTLDSCPNCGAPNSAVNHRSTKTRTYQNTKLIVNNNTHTDSGFKQNSSLSCPSNHLALAIVSTVLCCWATGIPAIVYAAKVNRLYDNGQYTEASEASHKAKAWSVVGIVIGVIISICSALYYIIIIGATAFI